MEKISEKNLKRGEILYIIQAALEYLITILIAGSFLATLTKQLGFSDSLTGIISSVIALGRLCQLISVSFRKARVKLMVVILSIVNQLLFLTLYIIPIVDISARLKTVLFIAVIFTAYITYNFAHPKKINWLMSLVDDHHRGEFTANKEIISLVAGMVFTYTMGALTDYFAEKGEINTAFIICAAVIFFFTVLHTFSLVFTVEKSDLQIEKQSIKKAIISTVSDKNILSITLIFILYDVSTYISTPFYGAYQINDLGFNLKFVSIITMIGSIVRILVSRTWGRYADRKGFAVMMEKCFWFMAAGQLCVVFAVPATGKVMFTLYYIFHGIAMGGVNSGLINLVFDNVAPEKRADSLAISQSVAGVTGFLSTLAISPAVAYIQEHDNRLFTLPIYAQQAVSALGLVFTAIAIIYLKKVMMKKHKGEKTKTSLS